jgi:hypothetical protein
MAKTFKDLTGNKYNSLTVLGLDSIKHKTQRFYKCLCDCGSEIIVYGSRLTTNRILSCGCHMKETIPNRKRDNLEGQRFGRLIVQNVNRLGSRGRYWQCLCDCGNTKFIVGYDLKSGKTQSCGCIQKEKARESAKNRNTTHGMTHTKVWECWVSMVQRCTNPNRQCYRHYGGRGINICDEWLEFSNFYKDMGNPPTEEHSVDRIDNNKGYYLENCRWATSKEQSNNRRNNHLLEIEGRSQTIGEWAQELNVNYQTLYYRVKNQLDPLTGRRR